ncbi:MAG: hypothetical protein U9N61_00090 [Euryarchaeota archaeon]|nr:hypothetical protein [Euryarchaeota archaeon]
MTNEEEGYNGWTNYETWDVALWINNDQGTQEHFHELTREVIKESDKDTQIAELAEVLQDQIDEDAPELEASMYSDLLTSAISTVDYYELAESLINDVKEMGAYEKEEESNQEVKGKDE